MTPNVGPRTFVGAEEKCEDESAKHGWVGLETQGVEPETFDEWSGNSSKCILDLCAALEDN